MTNVRALLLEAITYDQLFLAYSIYTAIQKNLICMSDDEEQFFSSELPFDEIRQAYDNDTLKLKQNSVKLFFIKYESDYAIYLAKNEQEAQQLHRKLFRVPAAKVIEATHKKFTSVYDDCTKKTLNFYDMQAKTRVFPKLCAVMAAKRKSY